MTEENTKDLTDSEKLNLILADLAVLKNEMADVKSRLVKVEAFVDDRSRDTRPKLEMIHKEVADIRAEFGERLIAIEREVKTIRRELGLLREDIRNERLERVELEERVSSLEGKPV